MATVLMDTIKWLNISPPKIENFTYKKGSHNFIFMLVSTAEILAKKSVVHGSIYIILQFLVQEFSIQFNSPLIGRVNPFRFCLPSPTQSH